MALTAGATGARGLALLSIPLLTRLYTPEQFGVFGLFSSVLLLLVPLATFRYMTALPLPRTDRAAFAVLALAFVLLVGFSLVLLVVALLAGAPLLTGLGLGDLLPYALLIPAGVFFASLFETLSMWATRARAYRVIAITQIWQAIGGEGSKLLLGVLAVGPIGLVAGYILGQVSGLRNIITRFWAVFRAFLPRLSVRHMRIVAHRYRGFPINRMPAQFLLALGMQAPLLLTAGYFDAATTGQMALAMTAFALPFALVGQATSRAYFGEMAKLGAQNAGEILVRMRQVMLTLGLMALPVSAVLFFYAEPIATFVLGADWAQAGRFISFLAIALVPQFISATVIRSLDILEAHRLVILLYLTRVVIVAAALWIPQANTASPETVVLAYACSLTVYYLVQTSIIYWALRREQRQDA